MRNTYTTAARAAHAPGDDTLARALKEALNSRALRARPSGHKCIDPARLRRGGGNASGRPSMQTSASSSACVGWYGFTCYHKVYFDQFPRSLNPSLPPSM